MDNILDDLVSDCCGAKVYAPANDWAICMDCKEACDAIRVREICKECRADLMEEPHMEGCLQHILDLKERQEESAFEFSRGN